MQRPSKPITVLEVARLAKKDGRHTTRDGTGLSLLVRGGGRRRVWVQRIAIDGREREIGHGGYDPEGTVGLTLAQARDKAREVVAAVKAGRDPVAEKAAEKAARVAAAETAGRETFAAALDAYIAAHGAAWRSPKTGKEVRSRLERHGKALMKKPAREIRKADVLAVLQPIWTTKPVLAQQIRARLEGILEWAKAAGWREGENPAAWRGMLQPLLAKPSAVTRGRHHPALPWQQVPAFLTALRAVDGYAARCLALVLLTAVRSGEARGAAWGEFDLDAAVWTIPKERMKAGKAHRVPLSAPAVALLSSLQSEKWRPDPAMQVFCSPAGGTYSDMALLAVVKRMDEANRKSGGKGWRDEHGERITPHGFRSAFRSWCGDHGHDRVLAEHALAHAVGSETERAYARSDLLARRRRLMTAWGEFCEGRPEGDTAPTVRVVAA